MTVGPFPVEQVVERIREHVPLARSVGSAADLDTALESPPNVSPALFVTATERGGSVKYSGPPHIQNADAQISVVLLVRDSGQERHGAGARAKATQVIAELRRALIGWAPHEAFTPLSFTAGRDERFGGGWYAGQQIFASGYRIQNQPL